MLSALEHRSTASAGEHHRPAPWRGSVVHDAAPSSSIMRRTRSGRADRRSNWRRVAPRSSVAGSVAPSRGEREPSRRRSPQPPAASRQPYSRTAVSRQLAVAVAAAAAAAVSELLRRVADAVWTRAAQRRASVLGVSTPHILEATQKTSRGESTSSHVEGRAADACLVPRRSAYVCMPPDRHGHGRCAPDRFVRRARP